MAAQRAGEINRRAEQVGQRLGMGVGGVGERAGRRASSRRQRPTGIPVAKGMAGCRAAWRWAFRYSGAGGNGGG